jgi:hypothetical protein
MPRLGVCNQLGKRFAVLLRPLPFQVNVSIEYGKDQAESAVDMPLVTEAVDMLVENPLSQELKGFCVQSKL